MVSVDDLTISLTIKETSKLGKLQKLLEDFQSGKVVQKGSDNWAKQSFQKIRSKLRSLIGNVVPTRERPAAMKAEALTLRKIIKNDSRALAEKLIPTKQGLVDAMKDEFGVETKQDLVDAMEDKLDEWVKRLELIMEGEWTSGSASGFMAALRDYTSRKNMDDDLRKTYLGAVEKQIGEFNKEIADLLKAAGITAMSEFKAYIIKPKSRQGLRQSITPLNELYKFLGLNEGKGKEALDKVGGLINSWVIDENKTPTDVLDRVVKALGIKLTPEMFKQKKKWFEDPDLAVALSAVFRQVEKTRGTKAIPGGLHRAIKDLLEEFYPSKDIKFRQIRPDIAILHGDVKKLTKVFGPKIAEALEKRSIGFIELKQILTESNAEQFSKYKEHLGNVVGVASVIRKSFSDILPDIVVKQLNVLNKLSEFVGKKTFTEEELESLGKLLEKDVFKETQLNDTYKLVKKIYESGNPETIKEMSNVLKDVNKKLDKKETANGNPEDIIENT